MCIVVLYFECVLALSKSFVGRLPIVTAITQMLEWADEVDRFSGVRPWMQTTRSVTPSASVAKAEMRGRQVFMVMHAVLGPLYWPALFRYRWFVRSGDRGSGTVPARRRQAGLVAHGAVVAVTTPASSVAA